MATIGIFLVLRSKTRRDILKVLMKREMHISGIAREFGISVPQASKHCKLMEKAGLIEKRTFGRTHVLKANHEALYSLLDYFSDEEDVEVSKGSNIIEALTQIAGVKVEKVDERGFVTSIDGEEGFYIYEVNGKLPSIPMDKYVVKQDITVELKKILHVRKKKLMIKVNMKRGGLREKFHLTCIENGEVLKTKGFDFSCRKHNSLVRSDYAKKRLTLRDRPGIWRFIDWLPVKNPSGYREKPVTYRSDGLASELGLENLFISFNGYWPEREVRMETCTFKELEGVVTIQYAKEVGAKKLVVASAGNTAKAFAASAVQEQFPVVLVIPEKCLCGVYLPEFDRRYAKTIILKDGDYSDSIALAKRISSIRGFTYEGGARNIARRDGLATVMLDAAVEIGKMPRHYFQAVGSGTGAIAAYEASLRLKDDGRFGIDLPKFHLSQNLPLAPMYSAWRGGRREIIPKKDIPSAQNVLDLIYARVLSNRYPPYGVAGGVYDSLKATDGEMYGVENREARRAKSLFSRKEEIDILPAAAVAVASLIQAIEGESVAKGDVVLLNITGGGGRRLRKDKKLQRIKVDHKISKDISDSELMELDV